MNLQKAIKILQEKVMYQYSASKTDEGDATKLGIEALKRFQTKASLTYAGMLQPLPGETEDQPYDQRTIQPTISTLPRLYRGHPQTLSLGK